MRRAILTICLLAFLCVCALGGDYGTVADNRIFYHSPWDWKGLYGGFRDWTHTIEATLALGGYSLTHHVASTIDSPYSVMQVLEAIRVRPGIIFLHGHGHYQPGSGFQSAEWLVTGCYSTGSAAVQAATAGQMYAQSIGGISIDVFSFRDNVNDCWVVAAHSRLITIGGISYGGRLVYAGMCHGKQLCENTFSTAKCRIGVNGVGWTDDIDNDYDKLINTWGKPLRGDIFGKHSSKSLENYLIKSINDLGLNAHVAGDNTLQPWPGVINWSVPPDGTATEDDSKVTSDGLEYFIDIRGQISYSDATGTLTSDHFILENKNLSDQGGGIHRASVLVLPPESCSDPNHWDGCTGEHTVAINHSNVWSSQNSNLVLHGGAANIEQILFDAENVAGTVSGFEIVDRTARWAGMPFDTECYIIDAADELDSEEWITIIRECNVRERGIFEVPLTGRLYRYYRLRELENCGKVIFHALAIPQVSREKPFYVEPTKAELLARLDKLETERQRAESISERDRGYGSEYACVFVTVNSMKQAVEQHVAGYWNDVFGVTTHIEIVDDYPVPDPTNRDAFRQHLRSRIAYYNNNHGVNYVHLIGDANDWEKWQEEWPAGYWAERCSMMVNHWSYPAEGWPERDLIPLWYEDDHARYNLSYWTPYIAMDYPYADITGDGHMDVALARWPVNSVEDVLAWAIKMQSYNDFFWIGEQPFRSEIWTGDLKTQVETDWYVEQVAMAFGAAMPSWGMVGYLSESQFPDAHERNMQAVTRMNNTYIRIIALAANRSKNDRPAKYFDNSIPGHEIFSVDQLQPNTSLPYIMGMSCGIADFQRTKAPYHNPPMCKILGAIPDRGFIALLGPQVGSWQPGNHFIGVYHLLDIIDGSGWGNVRSIAENWRITRGRILNDYADYPEIVKTLRVYSLIGDPLTPLRAYEHPVSTRDVAPSTSVKITGAVPNPFNPSVSITYTIPKTGLAKVAVFDIRGRHIINLVDEIQETGIHELIWNGVDNNGRIVASGTYVVVVSFGDVIATQKLSFVK